MFTGLLSGTVVKNKDFLLRTKPDHPEAVRGNTKLECVFEWLFFIVLEKLRLQKWCEKRKNGKRCHTLHLVAIDVACGFNPFATFCLF
jgi:hypothetical protein